MATYHGERNFDAVGWSVVFDQTGASEGVRIIVEERGDGDSRAKNMLGSKMPYANWLVCESATSESRGGFDYITAKYVGISPNGGITTLSCTAGVSEEPIDTHLDFHDFAGTPSDPKDGAVFTGKEDGKDTFDKFKAKDDQDDSEKNSKEGVTEYLEPTLTWNEKTMSGDKVSNGGASDIIEDVGKRIRSIPTSMKTASSSQSVTDPAKKFDGDRNWLLVHALYEEKGDGSIINRKYRMSGRHGWNEDIYEKASVYTPRTGSGGFGSGDTATYLTKGGKLTTIGQFEATNKAPENASISYKEDGTAEGSCTWITETKKGLKLAREKMNGGKHPDNSSLHAYEAVVTGQDAVEQVEVKYIGVSGVTPDWKTSFDIGTQSEPIDAHPDFIKELGGKLDDEKNGATFNKDGTFDKYSTYVDKEDAPSWWKGWNGVSAHGDNFKNAFAGVVSYLECGVMLKETKIFSSLQSGLNELKETGKIGKPNGGSPRVSGKFGSRTWLCMGGTWEPLADHPKAGCRVTLEWQISGERGWDEDIYEK